MAKKLLLGDEAIALGAIHALRRRLLSLFKAMR